MANEEKYREMKEGDDMSCEALRNLWKDDIEESRQNGLREGRREGMEALEIGLIITKIARKKNINEIAEEIEKSPEDIRNIYDTILMYPGKDEGEIWNIIHGNKNEK